MLFTHKDFLKRWNNVEPITRQRHAQVSKFRAVDNNLSEKELNILYECVRKGASEYFDYKVDDKVIESSGGDLKLFDSIWWNYNGFVTEWSDDSTHRKQNRRRIRQMFQSLVYHLKNSVHGTENCDEKMVKKLMEKIDLLARKERKYENKRLRKVVEVRINRFKILDLLKRKFLKCFGQNSKEKEKDDVLNDYSAERRKKVESKLKHNADIKKLISSDEYEDEKEKSSFENSIIEKLIQYILPPDVSRGDNIDYVTASIAPRAILLMIVPQLTPFSVYAVQSMGQPVLLFSKKAEKFFLPWIVSWTTAEKFVEHEMRASLKVMSGGNLMNYSFKISVYTPYLRACRLSI